MCTSYILIMLQLQQGDHSKVIANFRPVGSRGETSQGGSLGQTSGVLLLTSPPLIRHVYLGALLRTIPLQQV